MLPCETGCCPEENETYSKTYLKQQKCSGDKCQMAKDSIALRTVQLHLFGGVTPPYLAVFSPCVYLFSILCNLLPHVTRPVFASLRSKSEYSSPIINMILHISNILEVDFKFV